LKIVLQLLHVSTGWGLAHRARETVELLKFETPDFMAPNLWPPNSLYLNPVDYRIWDLLQERVYKTSI